MKSLNLDEHKDYMMLPDPDDAKGTIVEIRTGIYTGVQFKFGVISAKEFPDEDYAQITFDREILFGKELIIREDDFNQYIGQILDSILNDSSAVEYSDENGKVLNGNRNTNSEEPHS